MLGFAYKDVILALIPEMQAMRQRQSEEKALGAAGIDNPINYLDNVKATNKQSFKNRLIS